MSEIVKVVQDYYDSVWSSGDLDSASNFVAHDVVDHDALQFPGRLPGLQGLCQVVETVRTGIPNLKRQIETQVVSDDVVVTRFTDSGTHLGPLFGGAPTGREVSVRGINIERVVDGKITEIWHIEDIAGLMAQLSGQ